MVATTTTTNVSNVLFGLSDEDEDTRIHEQYIA